MFLGEIIKKYRMDTGMTMQDFADASGLSKSYISMLEKNRNPQNSRNLIPSLSTFQKTAHAMGISVDELVRLTDGRQKISLKSDGSPDHSRSNRIKVYGTVPAGVPLEAIEDIVDWEDIPEDWLASGKEYLGLKVKGRSMEPKYLEGDTIIVLKQDDCESGQDAVIYINGYDATLKRVIKQQFGIVLQPLNPEFEPMVYDYDDETNPITVLGIVVEIRRKIIYTQSY